MQERIIESLFNKYNLNYFGFTSLVAPKTILEYETALNENRMADMTYLSHHLEAKKNPQSYWGTTLNAIVALEPYIPHPYPLLNENPFFIKSLQIASYAKGQDYHIHFKHKLQNIANELQDTFKNHKFIPFTDSAPILERDLAFKAGLGWFGKNTCLINKNQGSFFFIGQILTDLSLPLNQTTSPNHCGQCQNCIKSCPTQALIQPGIIDANKCLSYWSIEAKNSPPDEIKERFGTWLFGCDICQQVCPWNKNVSSPDFKVNREQMTKDLYLILTSSNNALTKKIKATALSRAGAKKLKRTAIILAGIHSLNELKKEIDIYKNDSSLKDAVNWFFSKI